MTFKDTYRLEKVYYENIWTLLNTLKSYNKENVDMETVKELLDNAIADNESIIIIYKNLGELYSEVSLRYTELGKELKDLRDALDSWKDEINDKIDELNNYIMTLIRDIEQRLDAIEEDLRTMNRNIFLDLNYDETEQAYYLTDKNGNTVDFDDVSELAEFPHNVIVRYDNNGQEVEFEIKSCSDTSVDFYVIGLYDNNDTVKEITVSINNDDSVTFSEETLNNPLYTFGDGLSLNTTTNVVSVDYTKVQKKLTAGTNVQISSSNVISATDTKYTAGANVQISAQNVISATDTKYTAGTGISISAGNVISATGGSALEEGYEIDVSANKINYNGWEFYPYEHNDTPPTKLVDLQDNIDPYDGIYNGGKLRDNLGFIYSFYDNSLISEDDCPIEFILINIAGSSDDYAYGSKRINNFTSSQRMYFEKVATLRLRGISKYFDEDLDEDVEYESLNETIQIRLTGNISTSGYVEVSECDYNNTPLIFKKHIKIKDLMHFSEELDNLEYCYSEYLRFYNASNQPILITSNDVANNMSALEAFAKGGVYAYTRQNTYGQI